MSSQSASKHLNDTTELKVAEQLTQLVVVGLKSSIS